MVVGPRYFPKDGGRLLLTSGKPPKGADNATIASSPRDVKNMTSPVLPPEDGKINPLALTVRINGGADITDFKSHHHRVTSAKAEDGSETTFTTQCRIDTPVEADYYRNGGILHAVLRRLVKEG